ncbi:hypothetical protein AGMMS50230_03100 [Spirochaetia bacterium]|nr:hypothetical protein AGMMS50230_03100 [Spirochaetia bacterium]
MAAIVLAVINAKWIHPSLAVRLLKANLPGGLQDDSAIMEFAQRQPLEEKLTPILAAAPRILAFSVSIWNHGLTLELLEKLEQAWSSNPACTAPFIILGGPELTPLPPETAIFRFADFVIRGEGEEVFPRLCQAVLEDPAEAKTRYGKFIQADPVDLNAIKPGYDLYTDEDLKNKLIYVEASRGCPYACGFCQSAVKPKTAFLVREFPPEVFLARLDRLLCRIKNGKQPKNGAPRTIKFLDRSFNVNIPWALEILEYCLTKTTEETENGNHFQFHFEMVPVVFPKTLRTMIARFPPGSLRLEIGIQSLNPQTCALIQRTSNPERELEVLRFLRRETSALVHADLIAGLPGEDLVSFGRGFDKLWIALGGAFNEIQLGILKCLPGTPVHTMAEAGTNKLIYSKTAPYEVLTTDKLSLTDMEKIKNFARFWELIVNRQLLPLPPDKPVFARFMELSQQLFRHFGRNWGLPKEELRETAGLLFPAIEKTEEASA